MPTKLCVRFLAPELSDDDFREKIAALSPEPPTWFRIDGAQWHEVVSGQKAPAAGVTAFISFESEEIAIAFSQAVHGRSFGGPRPCAVEFAHSQLVPRQACCTHKQEGTIDEDKDFVRFARSAANPQTAGGADASMAPGDDLSGGADRAPAVPLLASLLEAKKLASSATKEPTTTARPTSAAKSAKTPALPRSQPASQSTTQAKGTNTTSRTKKKPVEVDGGVDKGVGGALPKSSASAGMKPKPGPANATEAPRRPLASAPMDLDDLLNDLLSSPQTEAAPTPKGGKPSAGGLGQESRQPKPKPMVAGDEGMAAPAAAPTVKVPTRGGRGHGRGENSQLRGQRGAGRGRHRGDRSGAGAGGGSSSKGGEAGGDDGGNRVVAIAKRPVP